VIVWFADELIEVLGLLKFPEVAEANLGVFWAAFFRLLIAFVSSSVRSAGDVDVDVFVDSAEEELGVDVASILDEYIRDIPR